MSMIARALFAAAVLLSVPTMSAGTALAQTTWPNQREGDFIIKDFVFASSDREPAD
jgi:hypothetical protein